MWWRTWVGLTYIWGVPRLVGRYCSYLLPKQDGGTSQIKVNKTQVCHQMGHPVEMNIPWLEMQGGPSGRGKSFVDIEIIVAL